MIMVAYSIGRRHKLFWISRLMPRQDGSRAAVLGPGMTSFSANHEPSPSWCQPIRATLHLLSESARQNLHWSFSLESSVDNEITNEKITSSCLINKNFSENYQYGDQENDTVQAHMILSTTGSLWSSLSVRATILPRWLLQALGPPKQLALY